MVTEQQWSHFFVYFGADCETDFYYSISIPTVPIEYCNYILQSRPRNDIFHKIPKFQESKCVREEIIWRRKFLLEAQVRKIYKKNFPKKIIFQKDLKSKQKYNLVEAKRGKRRHSLLANVRTLAVVRGGAVQRFPQLLASRDFCGDF